MPPAVRFLPPPTNRDLPSCASRAPPLPALPHVSASPPAESLLPNPKRPLASSPDAIRKLPGAAPCLLLSPGDRATTPLTYRHFQAFWHLASRHVAADRTHPLLQAAAGRDNASMSEANHA